MSAEGYHKVAIVRMTNLCQITTASICAIIREHLSVHVDENGIEAKAIRREIVKAFGELICLLDTIMRDYHYFAFGDETHWGKDE